MTLRRGADAAAALMLLTLPWLLYGSALDLWWSHDDFFQLGFAHDHSPGEYFLDPAAQERLPNRVLSPMLFASYDLDLALAGLAPAAFYAHQLASLASAALALFVLLRLWTGPGWALLGGGLFLLGPPVAAAAPLLMVRHYPEALALAALAAAAFTGAARRRKLRSWGLAGASAILYLAASLAKEIAVPLPFVLAFLPVGTARRRLGLLAPHGAALALYAAYRTWMLGTPLGGYGWVPDPGERWKVAAALPGRIAAESVGPEPWGWILGPLLGAAVLSLAMAGGRHAALVGAGAAAAVLPFVPVAYEVHPRFALTAWLLAAAALPPAARALGGTRSRHGPTDLWRRAAVVAALLLVVGSALGANRSAWAHHHRQAARMSAQYRGFLALGSGEALRNPLGPPAALVGLRNFARTFLSRPAEGAWFYDDLYLCRRDAGAAAKPRAVWQLHPEAARLREITWQVPELRRRHCEAIRWNEALEAVFARRGSVLSWELGPRRDGTYSFVLEEGRFRYEVPHTGGFRLPRRAFAGVRVRYDAPEGWTTYSPPLHVAPVLDEPLHWRRGSPPLAAERR